MTPFDVIKTRLQTVQPPPGLPAFPIPTAADECCQTTLLSSAQQPRTAGAGGHGNAAGKAPNPLTCINSAPVVTPSRRSAPLPTSLQYSTMQPATTPAVAPSGCLHPSKWTGIWGEAVTLEEAMARNLALSTNGGVAGAGGGTGMLVMPIRRGHPHGIESTSASGFWAEIAAVRREAGIRGLWKGVGTTM